MQVIVKGRNFHVPNSIKELATHKMQKLRRFLERIQTLEIEFSEEHNPRIADKYTVEVTLTTKQHLLRAHASGPDPASAVDLVLDKLEAQVKRLKGKLVDRGHRPRNNVRAAGPNSTGAGPEPLPELESLKNPGTRNGGGVPIESSDSPESGEGSGPPITRVKRFAIKPMSAEEAVLQMESLGHDFYLFVNAESEQAGVVYRRRDGSFGLIEPS